MQFFIAMTISIVSHRIHFLKIIHGESVNNAVIFLKATLRKGKFVFSMLEGFKLFKFSAYYELRMTAKLVLPKKLSPATLSEHPCMLQAF